MTDAGDPSLVPKDSVVLIPAVGSALALCWEVGSFLPVGGAAFSYFSITEHVSFAVPALPFAIFFVLSLFVSVVVSERLPSKSHQDTKLKARFGWIVLALCISGAAFAYGYKSAGYAALTITAILIGITTTMPPGVSRRTALVLAGVISLMLVALAQGVDFTRGRLNKEQMATVITNDGAIDAIMFRAGERGVLLYDRPRQHFQFLRWEAVRKIDWGRAPIGLESSLGRLYLRD